MPRHPLAAVAIICSVLGACGSDKPAASVGGTSVAPPTLGYAGGDGASSGADATQPAQAGGNADCAALKTNLADILVNWQLVIGLSNSPTSEWTNIPLGSLRKFGDQLAAVYEALGSDADAAVALLYMSGANNIVVRGFSGEIGGPGGSGRVHGHRYRRERRQAAAHLDRLPKRRLQLARGAGSGGAHSSDGRESR